MVKVDTSESRPEGGGNFFDDRCDCHFIVEGWEDKSAHKSPYLEVTVQSLAATKESQIGRKRTERFSLHPKAVGKLLEFACAVGLYSKPQWAEDKKNGVSPDLNLDDAIGRTFCAPIGMTPFDEAYWTNHLAECQKAGDTEGVAKSTENLAKGKGKSYPQLGGDKGFTFWAIGDSDADHVPLDQDSIAHFNGNLPTKQGTLRRRGDKGPPPAGHTATKSPAPVNPPAGTHQPAPQAPAAGGSFF